MKVIYTLLILLIPFVGFGQGWTLILDHPYANSNEIPYSFVEDDDGYLFVGTKQAYNIDAQYDTDIWIVKVGFNGDTILTKSLNFSLQKILHIQLSKLMTMDMLLAQLFFLISMG